MNDIAKKSISERLIKAMEQERFRPTDVAEGFGLSSSYISMIRKEVHWKACPLRAWEVVLAWVNSGDSLHHYFKAHTRIEVKKEPIEVKEADEVADVQEETAQEEMDIKEVNKNNKIDIFYPKSERGYFRWEGNKVIWITDEKGYYLLHPILGLRTIEDPDMIVGYDLIKTIQEGIKKVFNEK